jgi:hypothetical protein
MNNYSLPRTVQYAVLLMLLQLGCASALDTSVLTRVTKGESAL